jgi:hypothetical protein
MTSNNSLWKSFVASLMLECDKDAPVSKSCTSSLECEKHGEERMAQYNLCVEEIKNEGSVLGSLELHEEAMRRMNQRLGRDCVPSSRVFEEIKMDDGAGRLEKSQASSSLNENLLKLSCPPRKGNVLSRSIENMEDLITDMGLKVRGKHGHAASKASKRFSLPGRQASFKPGHNDEDIITATQVRRDLELSDLEDELVSVDGSFLANDCGGDGNRCSP